MSALARVEPVRMVDVDHLLLRLRALHAREVAGGFTSHAHGVSKAIDFIERDLASVPTAERGMQDAP